MLSSRNPHACYLQNLNDDGKLHNGLTAPLCSRAAPPQKHKLIAKVGRVGGEQHSSNKADSTKCSKCDQHKCQRWMSPTALVSVPAFFPVGATLFSSFKKFALCVKNRSPYRLSEWTLNTFNAQRLCPVVRTIHFAAVSVGILQRTLLWRTFYSLHGLFNNILLNNSGIKLYMLILPAFIHAGYYIRNSISAEPDNSFCFFSLICIIAAVLVQFGSIPACQRVWPYGPKMTEAFKLYKTHSKSKENVTTHAIVLRWPQNWGLWAQEDTSCNWGTWWWHKDI